MQADFLLTTALQVEVGCLRHPGASTLGRQLLGGDGSHGWQILATKPWAPLWMGMRAGTCHTGKKQWKEGGKWGGEGLWKELQAQSNANAEETLNAQANCYNPLWAKSTWNTGACANLSATDQEGKDWCSLLLTPLNCI